VTPARWWRARSLRTRLVTGSVVPLAVALVVGTTALAAIFSGGRVHELDTLTARQSAVLSQLVASGQLPAPLPLEAGSPLLAQVLSPDGQVRAATASASRLVPNADRLRVGVGTVERPSFGDVPMRVRVTAAAGGDRVVVAAPLGDVRRATRALRVVLVVVVPLLVLGATLLARLLVGLALRPVDALRSSAELLLDDPAQDRLLALPVHHDELRRLAETLNDVLTRLHGAVRQQQAFVADAAHELRSPLTSLRVQLDVAGRHTDLVDAAALVADLSPEVDRLTEVTDDLLLLARLEAGQRLRDEDVDLRTLVDDPGAPVLVRGDRRALERLVRNLTDNAHRHASLVRTTLTIDAVEAVVDVDDDGPGIPPPDRERVFDRWVRLDPAREHTDGGAGLGLALAREIATAHGGSLVVLDSPLGGARLQLRLRLPGVSRSV
jgi:signal transduction histidine kinase